MKERPILFSTPMVQAIMAGRKTMTRRIIKESFNGCLTNGGPHPCPNDPVVIHPGEVYESPCHPGETITVDSPQVRAVFHCSTLDSIAKCPYGKVGDVLWVRETWCRTSEYHDCGWGCEYGCKVQPFYYKADCIDSEIKWKSSIHMPKAAARIWLEITGIKVERLQDITEQDAIAEGIEENNYLRYFDRYITGYKDYGPLASDGDPFWFGSSRDSFQSLWRSINGHEYWDTNPWVWVISFQRINRDLPGV